MEKQQKERRKANSINCNEETKERDKVNAIKCKSVIQKSQVAMTDSDEEIKNSNDETLVPPSNNDKDDKVVVIDTNGQEESAQVKQTENDKAIPIESKENSNVNEIDNQAVGGEIVKNSVAQNEVGDRRRNTQNKTVNINTNDNCNISDTSILDSITPDFKGHKMKESF